MSERSSHTGLFPALLKHWRGKRGLSQLDLALAADVSARHVSFLETGRSSPSAEMVLRLSTTLGVPLRHVNAMLRAAGQEPIYEESLDALPPIVLNALGLMKAHQEPYPLIVINRTYQVYDLNQGAWALLAALLGFPTPTRAPDAATVAGLELNLARLTFDPHGAHPHIQNFNEVGRVLLWRVQREALADPDDGALQTLLNDLLAMPTIDPRWRDVDLSIPSDPVIVVHLAHGDMHLRFFTMVTAFQAPQNVTVEELRVESWFPYDDATRAACRALMGRERTPPVG